MEALYFFYGKLFVQEYGFDFATYCYFTKNKCLGIINVNREHMFVFGGSGMFKPYFYTNTEPEKMQNSVDVIAVFHSNGHLRPLYVKLEGYDSVKIEEVISSKTVHYAGIETMKFVCSYVFMNEKRHLELHYHVQEHIWSVPGYRNGSYGEDNDG